MMTEQVIREINKEKQLLAEPEPMNVADWDEAIMTELGHTNDDVTPTDLHPHLATMDMDGPHDQKPNNTDKTHTCTPTTAKPGTENNSPQQNTAKNPHKDDTATQKEEGDTNIPTNQPANRRDGCLHRRHQTQREREGAVKKPTGQRKKVRCLFLMPFIAIMALHLILVPTTHTEGPILLLPTIRRVRTRYTLPLRHRHGNKRGPTPHGYHVRRPCLLLLYIACFFHIPTAPNTGVPSLLLPRTGVHRYGNEPPQHTFQQQLGPPMWGRTPQTGTPKDIPAPAQLPQGAGTPRPANRHRGIRKARGGKQKSTV